MARHRLECFHLATQLITYDLRKPGQDYEGLFDAIKSLGDWWHCLGSVWIVRTSMTSSQIRDALRTHIDDNDLLLVSGLSGYWATFGLKQECNKWLLTNLSK